MQVKGVLILIIVLFSGSYGCQRGEEWPVEPHIEFIDFDIQSPDTAWLTISFRDGDGDLGVTPGTEDSSVVLTYIEVNDGVAEVVPLPQGFTYDMPDITPVGKNKAIDGEISVLFNTGYYREPADQFDAIRWRIYIKDRAGNISNEVETPDIIIDP